MRISDWSSDVCSSDLIQRHHVRLLPQGPQVLLRDEPAQLPACHEHVRGGDQDRSEVRAGVCRHGGRTLVPRSEEHTSELQSLMRISYAVFCLKKKIPSIICQCS